MLSEYRLLDLKPHSPEKGLALHTILSEFPLKHW